jgi:hypothetical protein
LWGILKSMVYKRQSNNVEHLKQKIVDACAEINVDILRKVTFNEIRKRYNLCVDNNGAYIEHLLK